MHQFHRGGGIGNVVGMVMRVVDIGRMMMAKSRCCSCFALLPRLGSAVSV